MDTTTPRWRTLEHWLERHEALDGALVALRRVAPERDPARYRRAHEALAARLHLHLRQEEALLLPAYEALHLDVAPNGAPDVIRADHERLRRLLAELSHHADPQSADALLERSELLSRLAGVLEHHDRREARYLKPVLDAHLDPGTVRTWLERFAAEEDALAPVVLEPLPAPPPTLTDPDPLRDLRLAVAQDAPLAGPWARVPVPDHPKGLRHHDACAALVARAERAPDLAARRDGLATLDDRLRLLALLAT